MKTLPKPRSLKISSRVADLLIVEAGDIPAHSQIGWGPPGVADVRVHAATRTTAANGQMIAPSA